MERRYSSVPGTLRLEPRADGEEPRIFGVAAVYYDGSARTEYGLWRGAVERIMPGAFDRAIAEDDVRALFNHDPNMILGRTKSGTLRLESQPDGLHFDTNPSETRVYGDVREAIRRGDVDGSSFSFLVKSERWEKDETRGLEVREIEEVELFDVGPVTFPAYTATSSGVRGSDSLSEALASYERQRSRRDIVRARREVFRIRAARY